MFRFDVLYLDFTAYFEHISHFFSGISFVGFEQVNVFTQ